MLVLMASASVVRMERQSSCWWLAAGSNLAEHYQIL